MTHAAMDECDGPAWHICRAGDPGPIVNPTPKYSKWVGVEGEPVRFAAGFVRDASGCDS